MFAVILQNTFKTTTTLVEATVNETLYMIVLPLGDYRPLQ